MKIIIGASLVSTYSKVINLKNILIVMLIGKLY